MKISKYKKYITWNIISLLGYSCLGIMCYFLVILLISSSGMGMRIDLDKYFYEFTMQHVVLPYMSFYKIQLTSAALLFIGYIFEKKYYKKNNEYGFRIFENHERAYSILFVTGLTLNFLPMYILTVMLLKTLAKMF